VLKLEQHILGAAMLVQLRRSLHRYSVPISVRASA
jgi:hypothetical protein